MMGARGPRPSEVDCAADPAAPALTKKGSSSAMEPRRRGREPPRESTSSRVITAWAMAAWSSRRARNSSSRPSMVRTSHRSGAPSGCGRRTLNWCPQLVHLTVVPRSETRASSNSYAVLQRSQVTSIGLANSGKPSAAGAESHNAGGTLARVVQARANPRRERGVTLPGDPVTNTVTGPAEPPGGLRHAAIPRFPRVLWPGIGAGMSGSPGTRRREPSFTARGLILSNRGFVA